MRYLLGINKTSAVVWPADEDEKHMEVIRIDGQLRKNLGVSLNDTVSITKASSKTASSITLVPVTDAVTIDKEFTDFVKNRLKGLPLMSCLYQKSLQCHQGWF